MLNTNFRKKMADSWFSYLQNQICREFEFLENGKKKFKKRNWNKKKINSKEEEHLFCYRMEKFLKKLE